LRQVGGFFSEYSGFLHQYNCPPRYDWNSIESGVKYYNPNTKSLPLCDAVEYGRSWVPIFRCDDDICFGLDQHAGFCCSAISLKQQFTYRHVAPPKDIIVHLKPIIWSYALKAKYFNSRTSSKYQFYYFSFDPIRFTVSQYLFWYLQTFSMCLFFKGGGWFFFFVKLYLSPKQHLPFVIGYI
jgi:hypothetical protein